MGKTPHKRTVEHPHTAKMEKGKPSYDFKVLGEAAHSSNQGLVVWDSQQKLVVWSEKCPDFWYYPVDILQPGMPMVKLLRHIANKGGFGPGDPDKLARRELSRIRKSGPDSMEEFQMLDGRVIQVQRHSMQAGGHASTYTDITEIKKTEEALKKAHNIDRQEMETRFKTVVDSSPAAITLKDKDGIYLLANQTFGKWMDSIPSELVGKTVHDIFPQEQADEIEALDQKAMESGEEIVTEGIRRFKDGQVRFVLYHKCPIYSVDGEVVAISTVITDITELQTVKEVREQLSKAVEVVPVGIALFDSDDKLVFFNSRYGELMEVMADILKPGVTFEEMIRTMVDRQPVKDASGREEEFIQERVKHHRNPTGYFDIRRENNWLLANETRLPDGGIFTIITDITERKQAEEALSESEDLLNSIIENVPVGLLIKDPDHIVERANRTYLNWYGFDADTMGGIRSDEIEEFQSAEEAEFMNAQEREVLTTGLIQTRLVERPFADGQIHTIDITKFPVYDQQGKITKVGSVSVDLTEQVQAQRALAHSEEKHRHFSADVAHELRTPLAVMRSHLDNLEKTETIQSLIKDVDAMSRLVSQLLATTRLDSLTVNPNDVADLYAIGTEAAKLFGPVAVKEGRSIEMTGSQDPVIIRGNGAALEMAVRNLVENAIRYSARETVVTIHVSDEPAISVIDRGRGIPPEQQEVIFQRFKRADRRSGGAGLGLSIVQRVAEAHQATIDVSDAPGGGAVFKISFSSAKA